MTERKKENFVIKLPDGTGVTQKELDEMGMTKSEWCRENAVSIYKDAKGFNVPYPGGKDRRV